MKKVWLNKDSVDELCRMLRVRDKDSVDGLGIDVFDYGEKFFLSSAENKLVLMQIFEDTDYGVRIFFDANNYVQITN